MKILTLVSLLLLSGCFSPGKRAAFYEWAADRLDPIEESN